MIIVVNNYYAYIVHVRIKFNNSNISTYPNEIQALVIGISWPISCTFRCWDLRWRLSCKRPNCNASASVPGAVLRCGGVFWQFVRWHLFLVLYQRENTQFLEFSWVFCKTNVYQSNPIKSHQKCWDLWTSPTLPAKHPASTKLEPNASSLCPESCPAKIGIQYHSQFTVPNHVAFKNFN